MRSYFRLKEFRTDMGLKQSDVAELFKCHQSNVSRIESNLTDLEKYQYDKLIEKYGKEVVSKYIVRMPGGNINNIDIYTDSVVGDNSSRDTQVLPSSAIDKNLLKLLDMLNKRIESLEAECRAKQNTIDKLISMMAPNDVK